MTARPAAGVSRGLQLLLRDAIDYAGLYPPAQLDMAGAVVEYASYLRSPDAWALGRFVVPAGRLADLAATADEEGGRDASSSTLGAAEAPWRLSAVIGTDVASDIERARSFNASGESGEPGWRGVVEAIEVRASTSDAIDDVLRLSRDVFDCFVEIPVTGDSAALVRAIASGGGKAKVRTGGTTAEAFPASDDLVRFLAACVDQRVRFKATAGLHHPLRGEYPLTYAPGSAHGTMFGFLNVFLAAAFLHAGTPVSVARAVLQEADAQAVRFDDRGVQWRDQRLSHEQLAAARELAVTSFGSCSFREPLDDLSALGMV